MMLVDGNQLCGRQRRDRGTSWNGSDECHFTEKFTRADGVDWTWGMGFTFADAHAAADYQIHGVAGFTFTKNGLTCIGSLSGAIRIDIGMGAQQSLRHMPDIRHTVATRIGGRCFSTGKNGVGMGCDLISERIVFLTCAAISSMGQLNSLDQLFKQMQGHIRIALQAVHQDFFIQWNQAGTA